MTRFCQSAVPALPPGSTTSASGSAPQHERPEAQCVDAGPIDVDAVERERVDARDGGELLGCRRRGVPVLVGPRQHFGEGHLQLGESGEVGARQDIGPASRQVEVVDRR